MTTDRPKRGRLWIPIALLAVIAGAEYARRSLPREGALRITLVRRTEVAPGIELVETELRRGEHDAGRLVAVYAAPDRVEPKIIFNRARRALAAIAPSAALVVNGGYFTPERKPTGLLVTSGRTLHPLVPKGGAAGSGVFVLEENRARLLPRAQAKGRDFSRARFAIQAGPRLIEPDGKDGIHSDDGARANRTAIGADGKGRIALVVTHAGAKSPSGTTSGPTLFELQRLLGTDGLGRIAPELALRFALNLDGGPSTGLHVPSESMDLPERSPVHSVITLRVKP